MGTLLSFILFFISNHRFFLATEILEFRIFLFSYLHGFLFSFCLFFHWAMRTSPFGTWVDGVV
jgi:hypothetical protein